MGCGKRVAGHRQRKSCCSGQAGAALSLLPAAQSLGCSSVRVSARLLSPCSKQELPLVVPETPGGLCGAPGEEHPPGPALGTAAACLRCGPTTRELAGTTREGPHAFPSHPPPASLFSVRVALVPGVVLPLLPASLAAQILVLSSAECSCCLDSARHIKTLTQAPFQLNELNAWGCRDESSSKGRPCASLRCFKDSLWQMLTGKDRSAGMAGK